MGRVYLVGVLVFCISSTFASQDIIIKTDDSELQGLLIEQNFEQGYYKLQLSDGSIIMINTSDVKAITHASDEPQPPTKSKPAGPIIEPNKTAVANRVKANHKRNKLSLYAGTLEHQISIDDGQKADNGNYFGLNFAVQYDLNNHASIYLERSFTNSRTFTYTYDGNHFDRSGENYISWKLASVINTNLNTGFNAFTGLGVMIDSYATHEKNDQTLGLSAQFGVGYRWRGLIFNFRYHYLFSDDYGSDIKQVSSKSLQVGLAFQ